MRLFNFFNQKREAQSPGQTIIQALMGARNKADISTDLQAITIPTVARCIQVLGEGVANFPLRYMRQRDGVYEEYDTHPLHYLLTVQPNHQQSAYTFMSLLVQQMYHGTGNAYVYPMHIDGEVTDLILLDPNCVSHDTANNKYYVSDPNNGVAGVFAPEEILHFFRFTLNGKDGISVMQYAKQTLSTAATGDAETLDRFANGGNIRGLLTNDKTTRGFGEYQDKELQESAIQLDNLFRSGARIASIPGQAQFINFGMNSTDMQFLETRKFSVEDICRIYGVPGYMVFREGTNNYKSAEVTQKAFYDATLKPIIKRIENEFNRKLVPQTMCCKRRFCFDLQDMTAMDALTQADVLTRRIQNATLTVNEARRMVNMPKVEGGDRVLVSTNLAPINSQKLTGEAAKQPTVNKNTEINV